MPVAKDTALKETAPPTKDAYINLVSDDIIVSDSIVFCCVKHQTLFNQPSILFTLGLIFFFLLLETVPP